MAGQISLVAYDGVPGKCFIKVPNERGRYMLTDLAVAYFECSQCNALKGEPCFRWVQGIKSYTAGTHYARRGIVKPSELAVPKIEE